MIKKVRKKKKKENKISPILKLPLLPRKLLIYVYQRGCSLKISCSPPILSNGGLRASYETTLCNDWRRLLGIPIDIKERILMISVSVSKIDVGKIKSVFEQEDTGKIYELIPPLGVVSDDNDEDYDEEEA